MSPASLPSGDGINMPAKLRNLYSAQKLDVHIDLLNEQKVYTTLDVLEGNVSVTSAVDTYFDEIEIEFVGISRTYVERLTTAAAVSGRSEAFHQFLKLQQPRLHQHYPDDQVLKAGQTYKFPFIFVIPQHLLPRVCRHGTVTETLREMHLQLPPTFGDKDHLGTHEALDDMVPDMASIRYNILARISKDKEQGEKVVRTTMTSKAKRLRVCPTTQEQPPLDVSGEANDYTMRREKPVRKGVLKGKLGTLVMEAAQPPSVRMQARSKSESPSSSMATIMLRFDPVDENAPPPRLGGLASKLKVCTFYASTARNSMPSKTSAMTDMSQGMHTEQLNLSSRCMSSVEWTRHSDARVDPAERRDSVQSTFSTTSGAIPEPSAAYKNKSFYTARLLVPISLPSNKTFVPTFHSCLISRIYQLKLELGVQTAGIGGNMELKVPLQVSCEPSGGDSSPRHGSIDSAVETDVDEQGIGEFFEPRTIRAPSEDLVGRSRIGSQAPAEDEPPGYSLLQSPGSARVPVF